MFTDFSCPFKCPSIFQLVLLIKGDVYMPPMNPDVVEITYPSLDQSSLAD